MVATDETCITCLKCEDRPQYADLSAFIDHLEERHPALVTRTAQGGRSAKLTYHGVLHVDYADYAETTADWVDGSGSVYAHYCHREERSSEARDFWELP